MPEVFNIQQQIQAFQNAAPLIQGVALLAIFALLLSLLSFLRSGRKSTGGHVNRVAQSVEEMKVKLSDVSAKNDNLGTELIEAVRRAEKRLDDVEERLFVASGGQEAGQKKNLR